MCTCIHKLLSTYNTSPYYIDCDIGLPPDLNFATTEMVFLTDTI